MSLAIVPEPAVLLIESTMVGWNDGERAFARNLISDPRMLEAWRRLAKINEEGGWYAEFLSGEWSEAFVRAAVSRLTQATRVSEWDRLTKTEQADWLDGLDSLVKRLERHLATAPVPLDRLGSFVPKTVTDQLDSAAAQGTRVDPWNVKWGLMDSLRDVASRQRELFAGDQWMRQPRHPKAARERFIFLLSGDCEQLFGRAMADVVALSATVAFDDDAITEGLVRRITGKNLHRQAFQEKP